MRAKRTASDYQRRYRQKMTAQGMIKVEVWVPRPLRGDIQSYAEHLRNQWVSPVPANSKEASMWNNALLLETLNESEQAQSGNWQIELIQGTDECLVITIESHGDLELFLSASGDQILASILLWPVSSIADQAAFNAELLRDHKLLPLSTFGITLGPDGQDWYELFGALSNRSTVDSILTEIQALADNTVDTAEAYADLLAAA